MLPDQSNRFVRAGKARAKQFTSESQKYARSFLPFEALSKGGKASWEIMRRTGRIAVVQQKISLRNQKNASRNHVMVREWLEKNCNLQLRECYFPFSDRMFEVDFVLGMNFVVEVDGFRFKEKPFGDATRDRRAEFQAKLKHLHKHGFKVFVFDARYPEKEFKRLYNKIFKMQLTSSFEDLPF